MGRQTFYFVGGGGHDDVDVDEEMCVSEVNILGPRDSSYTYIYLMLYESDRSNVNQEHVRTFLVPALYTMNRIQNSMYKPTPV